MDCHLKNRRFPGSVLNASFAFAVISAEYIRESGGRISLQIKTLAQMREILELTEGQYAAAIEEALAWESV